MNRKINLTKISKELYDDKMREKGIFRKIEKKEYKNFMSKNARYLKIILEALTISEYEKFLKPDFDEESNGYEFSEKDMDFLKKLINSYTSKEMKNLKGGHIRNIPDRFIVWIYEGIYEVFNNNGTPTKVLQEISICMMNRMDYPNKKKFCDIADIGYKLEGLASNIYFPIWYTNLKKEDNFIWITALHKELNNFLGKWRYIYSCMGEQRNEEINNMAEADCSKITENRKTYLEIEFELSNEIYNALENDTKLKELNKKRYEAIQSKTGRDTERSDYISLISQRICERSNEVKKNVIRRYVDDELILNEVSVMENQDDDFKKLMSSEDLLKYAIEEYKESLIPVVRPLENIPDIDFDEIRKSLKKQQKLKGKDNS